MLVTGFPAVVSAAPDGAASASALQADEGVRPDSASAMVTARVSGKPVEDISQRDEFTQVFANPDGTWTSQTASGPERVATGDGSWEDIDTTLSSTTDGVVPAATTADVVFSPGGNKTLVAMREGDEHIEWRWSTVLPTPVLDGGTATYPGAADGADLVVTATSTGFTHHIVLTEVPDAPLTVTMPIVTHGAELERNRAGGLEIKDDNGELIASAPAPVMWDASDDSEADPGNAALVTTAVTDATNGNSKVVLTPDQGFLVAPDTVYPVTIDPAFTLYPVGDAWVQNVDYTSAQTASEELRVGTSDGGARKARSFLRFNADGNWLGKNIINSTLTMRNFYSASCAGAQIQVQRVLSSWTFPGLSWGNQPSVGALNAIYSPAHGAGANCEAADARWNLTEMTQIWANDGDTNRGIRVSAVNETNSNSWRRYRSMESSFPPPRLDVTYNSYPNTPNAPSLSPGNPGYTTSTTPTFKTTVSDPNGGTVRAVFEVYQGTTLKWTGTTGYVSSGASASTAIGSGILANGATYTVKVKANDGTDNSKAYSAATTFTVDAIKPAVSVESSAFNHGEWRSDAPSSNTFTFTGSGDTASFAYTLDGVSEPAKAADSSGNGTVAWLPKNGSHTLTVIPTDKAGNVGTPVTFEFGVGSATLTTPNLSARSTGVFPVEASGPPSATGASLFWRYAGATGWNPAEGVTKASTDWTGSVANTSEGTAATTGTVLWDATGQVDPVTETALSAPAFLELRACFAYTVAPTQACTPARQVQLVPSAFGGTFPVTNLGPATLALFTGEMTLTETDAVDASAGAGRMFSSYDAATTTPGGFGAGWSTGLFAVGDTADLVDHRSLDGTLVLVTAGGASQTFAQSGEAVAGKTTFSPAEVDDGSRLVVGDSTATLTRAQGTVTTWALDAASGSWLLDTAAANPSSAQSPQVDFDYSDAGYPTWIAETEPGVASTCTLATQTAGCRGLKISYTGTGTAKRVFKIERLVAGTAAVTLAIYAYDEQGRLVSVCDPRATPQLCAGYTYTTINGRTLLATATPAGQKPWRFDYDQTGRLVTVKRALDVDSNTGSGDATWTAVYDLPTDSGGLPAMTTSAVAEWGQEVAPAKAFAVFSPNKTPAGAKPTSGELPYANLWYTDDQGVTTNTAAYGAGDWLVETSWYDEHGNVVRKLDGAGRARALAAPEAERATAAYEASGFTFYNTDTTNESLDARRVEDSYGPVRTATLRDGTTGPFRAHTSYVYDDEEPTLGGSKPALPPDRPSFDLVVEATHTASSADLLNEYDTTVVRNAYDPVVTGDGNGWTLGTPSRVQTRLQDGTWSTHVTRYDSQGRTIETRQPGGATNSDGSGADARTTVTSYYTAHASDPDCNTTSLTEPGWAGLVCKTKPAAQPAGNPMPTTYYATYSTDLHPTRIEERSGGTTRVTSQTHDTLGRPTSQTINIGSTTRTTTTGYESGTGLPSTESSSGSTVTTNYDSWGRAWKYTDAAGLTSTTTYTSDGQVATQNDGLGTYTYTYDGVSEHRRLPTSITLGGGVPGSSTLTYNSAGTPTTITYPNGLKATYGHDEGGTATELDYVTPDGTTLLSFSNTLDVNGRVLSAASAASEQAYDYDAIGRLTNVEDTQADGCTTRSYGFAAASERTSFTVYAPGFGGACQASNPTVSRNVSYDASNRIQGAGYTYDDLGRTLTVPAADTASGAAGSLTATYQVTDMIKSLTQSVDDGSGGTVIRKTSYGIDPAGRIDAIINETTGVETGRLRYRFTDASDAPTSIQASSDAGATWTTTRYLSIPGIGMAGTVTDGTITWQLANLHGDIVATQSAATGIDTYSEADEFGNPIDTSPGRYGWLGTEQRSTDTPGGLVLMGARVYNPATGLFLSVDPVRGGNLTQYTYPLDPINQFDLDGRECGPCRGSKVTSPDFLTWVYGSWRSVLKSSGVWHDVVVWTTGLGLRGLLIVNWVKIQNRVGKYVRYRCVKGWWRGEFVQKNHDYRWKAGLQTIVVRWEATSGWQDLF